MGLFGINLFSSSLTYDLVPIKLDVPHLCQEEKPECAIFSTMMVLKYFGVNNPDRERIKRMAEIPYIRGANAYGLGMALVSYDIDAEIVESKKPMGRKTRQHMIKELSKNGVTWEEHISNVEKMKEESIKVGVKVRRGDASLEATLSRINENTLPIAFVNEYRFFGSSNIGPHAVVVTGFDDGLVFYNDPMFDSYVADFSRKETFAKAIDDLNAGVIFASRRK